MPQTKEKTAHHRFNDLFRAYGITQGRRSRIKILNICISLDLIFSFSIFGYISLNPIAITTVHIPVLIAAMLCGPFGGAVTGMIFGLTSMWKASVSATAYGDLIFSPWKSGNVAGSLILSLGMRIIFGVAAGLLFSLMFSKLSKKWYALGVAAVSVIMTLFHSFIIKAVIRGFFPKVGGNLIDSIAPTIRHVSVWIVTAILVLVAFFIFTSKTFLMQYRELMQHKHSHKLQGSRFMLLIMLIFLPVSAAIVAHTFDRLDLINVTDGSLASHSSINAVHIAAQQLAALIGAIYIVALIMIFVYEKGNIAEYKLKEKAQEELYQHKLRKALDVMLALSRDYEIVLNTDTETDTVTMYHCSDWMSDILKEYSLLDLPFDKGGEKFYELLASEEDLQELLELTTKEKILGYLRNDEIFVHVFRNKFGRYGETKIVPVSDHEFVCGYTDVDNVIKEKMKQQERLEDAMRAAEAASKAKSAFLLNMSHDIRTPMNAIIGYTDILAKYRQDEKEFERCTGNIKASGRYLLDLINNVLEMARIESGARDVDIAPCDARTILGRTYIVFKEEAGKKGITLTYDRNVQHNFIYADKVKIQEIHLNIISNAVKYTGPGGSVRIFSQEIPDEREGWCKVRTTTTDTGIGMSPEFVEHIFDDFARENDSTSSGISGTGLGMGIVKKLVDMLGGTIEVKSEKGKGTSVTVVIPHRIADESQVEKEDDIKPIDDSLFKGKRVLLAEDNDLNAEIAAELLADSGMQVDRAKDGIICVSKLETAWAGYYDIILMDVQMPNMDGYQATKIIRNLADKQKAHIPIIAMTANAFAKDREEALASGMDEHISKPVSIDKLMSVIARFIKS